MNWNAIRPWLGTAVRLVLGGVWIWAALSKLNEPRTFTQAVRAYDATPEWLSKSIGYGLPVLELAIGILLVVGLAVRIAAIVSGVLFAVFLIGIIQAAVRGIQLDCGCFGGGGITSGGTQYTWDILRDIGLLILAAYLIVRSATRISVEEFIGRNDHVQAPSAKRMRSEQGRRKYNAMLEARRAEARSRNAWINASIAGVIVLIVLIGIGVQSNRAKIQGSVAAKNATVADGVVFGKKAAATVDIYEDFQCPNCLNFEKAAGATIDAAVRANKAQVHFHMISILDRSSSGNRYSSRAANAAICAAGLSIEDFVAYHNVLYGTIKGKQVQPAEGSDGRTNAQLDSYAKAAGITGSDLTTFEGCVQTERHKALVQAITDRASQDGVTGTPTVKVNGKSITPSKAAFDAAVAAALKNGPAPDPSVTPSPTPTSKSASSAVSSPAASTAGKSPAKTVRTSPAKAARTSSAKAARTSSAKKRATTTPAG